MKYLQSITGTIKGLPVEIDIPLKGQNLIITGKNGVGKTFFLNQINNTISKELLSKLNHLSDESLYVKKRFIRSLEKVLDRHPLFISIIDTNSLRRIKQLALKKTLQKEENNEFYIRSKEIIHEIYLTSKKMNLDNESHSLILESALDTQEFIYNINDLKISKRLLIKDTEELLYNLDQLFSLLNNFDKFTTLGSDLKVVIENIEDLNRNLKSSKVTFNYFTAFRQTQIAHATNTSSLEDYILHAKNGYENNLGQIFEQYLVNIKIERSLALTEFEDYGLVKKIDNWFEKLNQDLKFLFEDDSTCLEFDSKTKKFNINQTIKKFNFQNLSSGYSSIFTIYTELMMRSQFLDILPDELNGIVLIDEIDAHLHISLQRKILPFFIKSFPNIQFIVTTHSPFVITSANSDTVIFDLTDGSFIDDNLSSYSVESITQELFHVRTESLNLKESIDYIYENINSENVNFKILNEQLKKLQPYKSKLNIEAKNIYMQALNVLIDNDAIGDLDV